MADIMDEISRGVRQVGEQGTLFLIIGAHGNKQGEFCTKSKFTSADIAQALRVRTVKFYRLIVFLRACSSKHHREQLVSELRKSSVAKEHLVISSDSVGKITGGWHSYALFRAFFQADLATTWQEVMRQASLYSKTLYDNKDGKYENQLGWDFVGGSMARQPVMMNDVSCY